MKRLCSICARGGSKGVKGKNFRVVAGKPLIAHTIEQALATGLFETIAVSSDSDEILRIAQEFGAKILVKRPDDLASDTAAKVPAIRHCAQMAEAQVGYQFDTFCDLDATSPLRLPSDIVEAVELLESSGATNIITAMPSRRSPYFNMVELDELNRPRLSKQLAKPLVRRQDAPRCFDLNASIYVWQREALMQNDSLYLSSTKLMEMPEERSWDIDTEFDFQIVNWLMESR